MVSVSTTLETWVDRFAAHVAAVAPNCRSPYLVRCAASGLYVDLGDSDPTEIAQKWMASRCGVPRRFLVGATRFGSAERSRRVRRWRAEIAGRAIEARLKLESATNRALGLADVVRQANALMHARFEGLGAIVEMCRVEEPAPEAREPPEGGSRRPLT